MESVARRTGFAAALMSSGALSAFGGDHGVFWDEKCINHDALILLNVAIPSA